MRWGEGKKPVGMALLAMVAIQIYDRTIGPVVSLNIEKLAERYGWDKFLAGVPESPAVQTIVMQSINLLGHLYHILSSQLALAAVAGGAVVAFWDWLIKPLGWITNFRLRKRRVVALSKEEFRRWDMTPAAPPSTEPAPSRPAAVEDRVAKAELASFVAQQLIPAVRAQVELQAAAIKKLSNGVSSMEKMSIWGNEKRRREEKEYSTYIELERAAAQNFSNISFDDLMQKIVRVHTFYIGEASYAGWICRSANVDYRNDDSLRQHYKTWRRLADDVERVYRRFLADPRFTRIWKAAPTREIDKDFVTDQ